MNLTLQDIHAPDNVIDMEPENIDIDHEKDTVYLSTWNSEIKSNHRYYATYILMNSAGKTVQNGIISKCRVIVCYSHCFRY